MIKTIRDIRIMENKIKNIKNRISNFIIILLFLFISFSFTSCGSMFDKFTSSLFSQRDVKLIGNGAPAYLLLIEGLISAVPKNRGYLQIGIQTFSAYSEAFVDDPIRKKIFSEKCKDWGKRLLMTYPQFANFEKSKDIEKKNRAFDSFLKNIKKRDVPYVFWASYSWIMWIMDNLDSVEALMDLGIVKQIIDRVYVVDGDFYYSAPHLFYAIFYAAFPKEIGGNIDKAKNEFDYVIEKNGDKLLMAKMSYAIFYLKPQNQKEEFKKVLKEILNYDLDLYPDNRLLNLITQDEANKLLNDIDNLF